MISAAKKISPCTSAGVTLSASAESMVPEFSASASMVNGPLLKAAGDSFSHWWRSR
ncbi:hypothetical protein D3C87_2029220 [compost metagenome]